jgi:hypothetical protein
VKFYGKRLLRNRFDCIGSKLIARSGSSCRSMGEVRGTHSGLAAPPPQSGLISPSEGNKFDYSPRLCLVIRSVQHVFKVDKSIWAR